MRTHYLCVFVLAVVVGLASSTFARAQDGGGECVQCVTCTTDYDTANYLELGGTLENVTGNEEAVDQRGEFPANWLTSGRLHFPADCWNKNRFEVRWQDVASNDGRAWGRLSLWPMTVESDGYIFDNFGWVMTDGLALAKQQETYDDVKLRWHRGLLDNSLLRYEKRDMQSTEDPFKYQRLGYSHNFNLSNGRVLGSLSQTGTTFNDATHGVTDGKIDVSAVRLDAKLNDRLALFGRGTVSQYDYANLPDDEMQATDYTVGFNYKLGCNWAFKADYRNSENPTDNTVSSHVEGSNSYGAVLSYEPGCNKRIEGGYRHKSIDYTQLNMQDPAATALLHGTAVVRPADVAAALTFVTPDLNEMWLSGRWALSDKLTTDARISMIDSDAPGTDLVAVDSPSLFYNKRLDRTLNLYYDVNGNDQLAAMYNMNESSNDARGGDFDMRYLQGSWSRSICAGGYFSLVVSNSDYSLDNDVVTGDFTTDETTYAANFKREFEKVDYGLDLAYTNGDGLDEYKQTAIGGDLALKCLGPLSLRVDWFNRDYTAQDSFSGKSLEMALRYHLDF